MDIVAATRPAPGRVNDDTFIAGAGFAAVLDGATAPAGRDSGCVHDVPWLVSRLSGRLARALTVSDDGLDDLLAETIGRTRDDHRDSCDLSNPDSPTSTVTVVRVNTDTVDYLVLGDSPLLVQAPDGQAHTIVDDRVDRLPSYTYEAVARLRNSPEGFWVAGTDPAAARHALTGSLPRGEVARLLLLSDGVSRLVSRHGHSWEYLLATAEKSGPRTLVDEAHAADTTAPPGRFRGKPVDDATAVLCRM